MDCNAILDYALFQLTPTRTRCDLVVFCGKRSEKLASGLLEPFVAHLQYAKDQIPKGGYSITLRPPHDDASWFTKATFQRFVRFVSTPEILERIIRIEREILQIDSSTQSNENPTVDEAGHSVEGTDGNPKKSTNSSKLSSEEEDHGAELRGHSRARLQHLMDTRKTLLLKEQAMAYARAVVAGYEMEDIDDLICFADKFGASQLREACIDFTELYNRKHSNDQWRDELAAVQASSMTDLPYLATSGIMLTGENFHGNGSSVPLERTGSSDTDKSKESNSTGEQRPNMQQVPWMNQIPPYMYNFQGPMQQMPPYQGYHYPGMPPYYPGNMGWPSPGCPNSTKNHRSSRRKEKSFNTDKSEEDESTASGDSDVGTDSYDEQEQDKKPSSRGKKNKKKSSKTVVIRNINYITSQRHNGDDNEHSDESTGDDATVSLEKHARKSRGNHELGNSTDADVSEGGKSADPWGAFQNLLLSNEDSNPTKHHAGDPMDEQFLMNDSYGGRVSHEAFDLGSEKVKKQPLASDDSALVIHREGENGSNTHIVGFANGEETQTTMKRTVSENENALFARQSIGSRTTTRGGVQDFSSESATIRNRREEDLLRKEKIPKNKCSYGP
ncbi:hypothetical protein SASPL_146432 [Salvia splendens]|uniref:Uncharacterized protein n=1 Tax=Salvia splendens TaxID=180675 RepID=A0A8X8Z5S4_SALSN|nr:hypothetical protein SASPL_146432 [Salvia splendens]